jgi:plastocyanin
VRVALAAAAAVVAVAALLAARAGVEAQARAGPVEASVADDKGKPIEDAVISLVSLGAPAAPPAAATAVMDQHDREFVPYVLPVYIGTPVNFPNRDNIRHHVYSFSPAKTFELKLYAGTPGAPVVFDKPGVVVLGCNIHDLMTAWVVVVDTPHHARSAEGGKARLEGVAPGSYRLRAWHPGLAADAPLPGVAVNVAGNELDAVIRIDGVSAAP